MTQHRLISSDSPDWSHEGRTIVYNFPSTAFWHIVWSFRKINGSWAFLQRDRESLRSTTAMADSSGWASAQENDFPNFQSNDSFNWNEVTGIDGRSCAPLFSKCVSRPFFYFLYLFPPTYSRVFREANIFYQVLWASFFNSLIDQSHYLQIHFYGTKYICAQCNLLIDN